MCIFMSDCSLILLTIHIPCYYYVLIHVHSHSKSKLSSDLRYIYFFSIYDCVSTCVLQQCFVQGQVYIVMLSIVLIFSSYSQIHLSCVNKKSRNIIKDFNVRRTRYWIFCVAFKVFFFILISYCMCCRNTRCFNVKCILVYICIHVLYQNMDFYIRYQPL